MIQAFVFGVLTAANLIFSWRWLGLPRSHGFYRFFAFESLLGLVIIQAERWFSDPLSMQQLVSWLFLASSLMLALHGFWLLGHIGKPRGNFERTTVLVSRGAYRYIRHPLYCSLLLGTSGAVLKSLSIASVVFALSAIVCIVLTAVVEERENLARFGAPYASYKEKTRMFLPWLF